MAKLYFRFNAADAIRSAKIKRGKNRSDWAVAVTESMREVRDLLEVSGRNRLRRAGNFVSARWQQGLHVEVTPRTGALLNPFITVSHDVKYSRIFEYGGVIKGKPLLWIPLGYTGLKMRARDYGKRHGGLFRVDRKIDNLPLLLSIRDRKPKYFGKAEVTIKPKWGLRDATAQAGKRFGPILRRRLRELRKAG